MSRRTAFIIAAGVGLAGCAVGPGSQPQPSANSSPEIQYSLSKAKYLVKHYHNPRTGKNLFCSPSGTKPLIAGTGRIGTIENGGFFIADDKIAGETFVIPTPSRLPSQTKPPVNVPTNGGPVKVLPYSVGATLWDTYKESADKCAGLNSSAREGFLYEGLTVRSLPVLRDARLTVNAP